MKAEVCRAVRRLQRCVAKAFDLYKCCNMSSSTESFELLRVLLVDNLNRGTKHCL